MCGFDLLPYLFIGGVVTFTWALLTALLRSPSLPATNNNDDEEP
jgi:hypothetical protein